MHVDDPRPGLSLHDEARRQLLDDCRRRWPEEACGLLLGQGAVVRAVAPVPNAAAGDRRVRFEIAPADLLRADGEARSRGLEVLGSYHSHPERDASPSGCDRAAAVSGWLQLIVGLPQAAEPELRGYRPVDGRLVEEAIASLA